LSLYWFDWEEGYGGDEVVFPQGYKQIVNSFVGDLDIRLENVVTKIEYDDGGVTVLTKDDSFDGDYVISTLPLGVLKQGTVEFSPPLPHAKQNAIDNLDVGILNKGYLMFPEAFWDDTDVIGYVSEDKGYWADFLNIHKYTGKPILLAFNAATYAEHLETKSDQETVNEMMQVLKMIYGDDIPEPENYLITRWGSDEFSFGSYSYIPVGGTPFDYDELAKPVMNRLFFAGEATIKEAPATVHGAYLSGIREADRISDMLE